MTTLEKSQEELIKSYLLFATSIHHRNVMLMSCVIQSCSIREIGYEVESTPNRRQKSRFRLPYHISWQHIMEKIEFYLWRVECRTVHSAFLLSHQTLLNEFKTPATESNFILFLSFYRIGFRSVGMFGVFVLRFLLWIRQLLFQHLETLLSSCLSGLLFSNVYFLDKIPC